MPHNDLEKLIADYAEEAEMTGWFGPEVIFGLAFKFIKPGQELLDIGIGTGLGSVLFRQAGVRVHGLDNSPQMLVACRSLGYDNLQQHDLTIAPYPYPEASFDLVICTGVMNFFADLSTVFRETSRLLKNGGYFGFVTGFRHSEEAAEIDLTELDSNTEGISTIYRHSNGQIANWMLQNDFQMIRNLTFTVFLDRERNLRQQARACLVKKA